MAKGIDFPPRSKKGDDASSEHHGHKRSSATKGRGRRAARESKRSGVGGSELPKAVHPSEPVPPGESSKSEAAVPSAAERFQLLGSVPGAKDVRKAYVELGKRLQGMGIKPWLLPANAPELAEAWDRANSALDQTRKLSEEYEKETDPAKKVEIAAHIRRLEINLLRNGSISKKIEAAAEKFKKFGEEEEAAIIGEAWDLIPPGERNKVPEKEPEAPVAVVPDEEVPFDPHSVPSVDDSTISAPQYAPRDMQEDMDTLASKVDTRSSAEILAEAEEGLKILPGTFGAKPKSSEVALSGEKREFHKDGSEYVDFVESPAEAEGTPLEWHKHLADLIAAAKGKLYEVKEKASELFDKAKEFLTSEDTTLAEKAKTLGKGAEEMILKLGEEYRKAPLKYKIALSAALIGGSIATGGAGTFVTLLGAAKLGQRSAASLGVYALVNGLMEKRLAGKEEKGEARGKWDNAIKQFVSGGAALAVFSGLPGYAMKEGFEAAGGGRAVEWLGSMLGHAPAGGAPAAGAAAVAEAVPGAPAAAAAAAGEAAVAPAFEMPTVGASAHGYEGMLKDLINKLPDTPPAGLKPGSDLAKLFEAKANPESIGGAIHRIAMEHKFFTGEGSVRIDTGAHMTVDAASGNVLFNGEVQAPAGAPVIPEYHPSVAAPAEEGVTVTSVPVEPPNPVEPFAAPAGEVPAAPEAPPLAAETVISQEAAMTHAQDAHPNVSEPAPEPVPAEAPAPSAAPETIVPGEPPTLMIEHAQEFINPNELTINPLQGHVFADPSGAALAYGNDFAARFDAAQEFVKANRDAVVWVQAEKPVFIDNAWRPWVFQVKYSGVWPFGSVQAIMPADLPDPSQIGAVNPDSFIKQLDK